MTELSNELTVGLISTTIVGVLVLILVSFRQQVKELVNRHLSFVEKQEKKMLEVTTAISAEIQLLPLLEKVMDTVTDILAADRSTLFLFDNRTNELWSHVAQGIGEGTQIRIPSTAGIAGNVFTTGDTVNIKDAYKDSRFNRAVDKKTGYKTRSILCMQVRNKTGEPMGVVQVLNKKGGPFTATDERRLGAFSAQAAIAIQNAQLFEEINNIRNYNEAMLESMTNGVLSVDAEHNIVKANKSALRLFDCENNPERLIGQSIDGLFARANAWIVESITKAVESGEYDEAHDEVLELPRWDDESDAPPRTASINLGSHPLTNVKGKRIGCLLMFEDITVEKRLRSTMARYMPKEVADRLLEGGDSALGGHLQKATVLFSDIRAFTSLSERAGPQETVAMLNDYFSIMAELIMTNGGILDKYIGDAIMAVFGAPFVTEDDADNAMKTSINMIRALKEFNRQREARGKEPIEIGIGLNTDQVLSGNIGSERRMDYTVIGDGVNLAARLETANKTYGSLVLISEFTVNDLKQEYRLREVDRLIVKGKEEAVAIYETLDIYSHETFPNMDEVLVKYGEGQRLYRDRDFALARTRFAQALELNPDDHLSRLYQERCLHFQQSPPPENWDGVWRMTTK